MRTDKGKERGEGKEKKNLDFFMTALKIILKKYKKLSPEYMEGKMVVPAPLGRIQQDNFDS